MPAGTVRTFKPAETFMPFARPSISPEALAEVAACLQSGWITTGPRVKKFEEMLKAYVGAHRFLYWNRFSASFWGAAGGATAAYRFRVSR